MTTPHASCPDCQGPLNLYTFCPRCGGEVIGTDVKTASITAEGGHMPNTPNIPQYYKDANGEWRWKVQAANNRIIDASSEGFSSRAKAENNYKLGHKV